MGNINEIPVLRILIITLSDRASKGEYSDRSGPEIHEICTKHFSSLDWKFDISREIIPDSEKELTNLINSARNQYNIIFTTGGTGIGPRDITVDVVESMMDKHLPGVMELIRVKYGMKIPNALLSRAVAGVCGKALIFTLPGSVKAVREYMEEINKIIEHAIFMQYGIDVHGRK